MPLRFGSAAGSFTEEAENAGFDEFGYGRGLVLFDYDRDGDIDVLVMNNSGPLRLWRNDGGNTSGNHVSITLAGRQPNRSAIGATVTLREGGREQTRTVRAGSNYASQDPPVAYFGVGSAERVDEVRVRWPDGQAGPWLHIDADGFVIMDRASSRAMPWVPPAP